MTGYSRKSLLDKLGIAGPRQRHPDKQGKGAGFQRRSLFIGAPPDYSETLGPLPPHVLSTDAAGLSQAVSRTTTKKGSTGSSPQAFDFIQIFCRTESELAPAIPILKRLLAFDGMLWISWPKLMKGRKSAPGDLNEARVRALGLDGGLVDVKVCAIDETWSGLKFVFRLKDRP